MTYELNVMELYTEHRRLDMSGDASFEKGGGSRNSHEMRLSSIHGIGLLISPALRTYTANIGIWQGLIPM